MTRILTPVKKLQDRKQLVSMGLTLLIAITAGVATALVGKMSHAHQDREDWVQSAYRGYHNVKSFCSDRQIFGVQEETPPIVRFYLNEQGAFDNTYADWRVSHDGQRIIYRLEVQFQDFDEEMLTRVAELDAMIDDGDLLAGRFQLSMSGFSCSIPGPASTTEQLAGHFHSDSAVNPI